LSIISSSSVFSRDDEYSCVVIEFFSSITPCYQPQGSEKRRGNSPFVVFFPSLADINQKGGNNLRQIEGGF